MVSAKSSSIGGLPVHYIGVFLLCFVFEKKSRNRVGGEIRPTGMLNTHVILGCNIEELKWEVVRRSTNISCELGVFEQRESGGGLVHVIPCIKGRIPPVLGGGAKVQVC